MEPSRHFQRPPSALDAGGAPSTVAQWINDARIQQATAQQHLNRLTAEAPPPLTDNRSRH